MSGKTRKMIALALALCMLPVLLPAAEATGKSDNAVPVTMTANKAALSSSVPASVAVYAKVDVVRIDLEFGKMCLWI